MSISAGTCSRFAILSWINDTLLLPLTKIQQLGAGNVYCQLLDAAYPERVPLHKVKWDAKLEIDFLHNFKILITCFQYLGIQKKIDTEKLAKAKYQDNLQFVQWLKRFVEEKIDYSTYEPLKRRNFAKIHLGFANKTKFQVTMNSTNKENMGNLDTQMKSSVKSSTTMKSSAMMSSRSSVSILSMSTIQTNLKPMTAKDLGETTLRRPVEKRKAVGPVNFISLRAKHAPNDPPAISKDNKTNVRNVEVIESQGSEDEFF